MASSHSTNVCDGYYDFEENMTIMSFKKIACMIHEVFKDRYLK